MSSLLLIPLQQRTRREETRAIYFCYTCKHIFQLGGDMVHLPPLHISNISSRKKGLSCPPHTLPSRIPPTYPATPTQPPPPEHTPPIEGTQKVSSPPAAPRLSSTSPLQKGLQTTYPYCTFSRASHT